MSQPAAQAPGGTAAAPARLPAVSSAPLDLLIYEYIDYLLRNNDDSREGRERMALKMEATGFDVGRRFAERLLRDRERVSDPLDAVKWLCREFWVDAFRKPVDRLQTNNRGVFVLQDLGCRWTRYLSGGPGEDSKALALKYLLVPCGMIRGALAAWGLDAVVNVDVTGLPKAVFHVRLTAAAFTGGAPVAAAAPASSSSAAAAPPPAAAAVQPAGAPPPVAVGSQG